MPKIKIGETELTIIVNNYDANGDDYDWCDVTLGIENEYIHFNNTAEYMTKSEVEYLIECFDKLLRNQLEENKNLDFMEPDISFQFRPQGKRVPSGNLVYIKGGCDYLDIDLKIEFDLPPYGDNGYWSVILDKEEIVELYKGLLEEVKIPCENKKELSKEENISHHMEKNGISLSVDDVKEINELISTKPFDIEKAKQEKTYLCAKCYTKKGGDIYILLCDDEPEFGYMYTADGIDELLFVRDFTHYSENELPSPPDKLPKAKKTDIFEIDVELGNVSINCSNDDLKDVFDGKDKELNDIYFSRISDADVENFKKIMSYCKSKHDVEWIIEYIEDAGDNKVDNEELFFAIDFAIESPRIVEKNNLRTDFRDEELMPEDEIHDFAFDVVTQKEEKNGYKYDCVSGKKEDVPTLRLENETNDIAVIVRGCVYPDVYELTDMEIDCIKRMNEDVYLAEVQIKSKNEFRANNHIALITDEWDVKYDGLVKIDKEKLEYKSFKIIEKIIEDEVRFRNHSEDEKELEASIQAAIDSVKPYVTHLSDIGLLIDYFSDKSVDQYFEIYPKAYKLKNKNKRACKFEKMTFDNKKRNGYLLYLPDDVVIEKKYPLMDEKGKLHFVESISMVRLSNDKYEELKRKNMHCLIAFFEDNPDINGHLLFDENDYLYKVREADGMVYKCAIASTPDSDEEIFLVDNFDYYSKYGEFSFYENGHIYCNNCFVKKFMYLTENEMPVKLSNMKTLQILDESFDYHYICNYETPYDDVFACDQIEEENGKYHIYHNCNTTCSLKFICDDMINIDIVQKDEYNYLDYGYKDGIFFADKERMYLDLILEKAIDGYKERDYQYSKYITIDEWNKIKIYILNELDELNVENPKARFLNALIYYFDEYIKIGELCDKVWVYQD